MKTIKQIPIKILNAQIKASQKLLDYYEGKIEKLYGCPLCEAVHDFYLSCVESRTCPWFFIEDKSCGDHDFKGRILYELRDKRYPRWLALRIPMLKRWIKLMRQEIKRRQNKI